MCKVYVVMCVCFKSCLHGRDGAGSTDGKGDSRREEWAQDEFGGHNLVQTHAPHPGSILQSDKISEGMSQCPGQTWFLSSTRDAEWMLGKGINLCLRSGHTFCLWEGD